MKLYFIKQEKNSKGTWSLLLTPEKPEVQTRTINGVTKTRMISKQAGRIYRTTWDTPLDYKPGDETVFEATEVPCLTKEEREAGTNKILTPSVHATTKTGVPIYWAF